MNRIKFIDHFWLKVIALVTMTIDHIGYFLYGPLDLRLIGRISFPIFAFMITEGYRYTRDVNKYLHRLSVCALAIQIFCMIVVPGALPSLNIFFTLASGLLLLIIYDKKEFNIFVKIIITVSILWLAEILVFDYMSYGVLLILLFYYTKDKILITVIGLVSLNYLYIDVFNLIHPFQYYSWLSLIFIYLYNGKKGINMNKYFAYVYYPIHIILLFLLGQITYWDKIMEVFR